MVRVTHYVQSWLLVFQQDEESARRGSSGTGTAQRADNARVRNRGVNVGVTNGSLGRGTRSSDEGICGSKVGHDREMSQL